MDHHNEPRSATLLFDPDAHPDNTLKAFNEFCVTFVLRYNALYPDPPKVSMDSALARWKITAATADNANPTPTVAQYDQVRDEWRSKDKVTKFLGLFSSQRFQTDWIAAQPDETHPAHSPFLHLLHVVGRPCATARTELAKSPHSRGLEYKASHERYWYRWKCLSPCSLAEKQTNYIAPSVFSLYRAKANG